MVPLLLHGVRGWSLKVGASGEAILKAPLATKDSKCLVKDQPQTPCGSGGEVSSPRGQTSVVWLAALSCQNASSTPWMVCRVCDHVCMSAPEALF